MSSRILCRITAVCLLLALVPLAPAEPPGGNTLSDAPAASGQTPFSRPAVTRSRNEDGGKRMREGTRLIDVEGRFDSNGERWIFFPADSSETYKVLENLALERIHKVMEETRAGEKPHWIISATATEYLGTNCLLVTKAVIKVQAAEPPPERGSAANPAEGAAPPPGVTTGTGQLP